jgi:phage terminase large subunit
MYSIGKVIRYGAHIAPHDIVVREFSTGKSKRDLAFDLGIDFQVAPKLKVMDGIDTTRTFLNKCWFDQDNYQERARSITTI